MSNVHTFVATLAVVALTMAGCGSQGDPDEPGPTTEPSATATTSTTPAVETEEVPAPTTPLEGMWRLKQTRQDVMAHLRQFGFDDIVERFVRVEGVTPVDHWRWTFTGDTFVASWQNPDGSWKVADSGTFEVTGKKAVFTFAVDDEGDTTTFRWRTDGKRLWLVWDKRAGAMIKGIPDEAYWRAYLTKPLTRVR